MAEVDIDGIDGTAARKLDRLGGVTTASRLRPVTDDCLPVDEALADLFPEGGLVRGRITGVAGPASLSLALALTVRAVTAGSWLAVVGIGDFGIEAAIELGVPASRVVAVEAGGSSLEWAERVTACADGFDLIVTRPPGRADRLVRRVRQRLQTRGAVLLPVGYESPGLGCDVELVTSEARWIGIGDGHGALLARTVAITTAGRRRPATHQHRVWLPGLDGRAGRMDHRTDYRTDHDESSTPHRHRLVR